MPTPKSKREKKVKPLKVFALYSKWGFHVAYGDNNIVEQRLLDGLKKGLKYHIVPCFLTPVFPKKKSK